MRALVVEASRHGATQEIARVIALELRAQGIDTNLLEADAAAELATIENYEAVIVGSAVYMGHWLPEAAHFVQKHERFLATVPFWLFSSGPAGPDENAPHAVPEGLTNLMGATHARGHRVFPGRLDPKLLGFGERVISKITGAPKGDFRDWESIREWARGVAAVLGAARATETPR